MKNNNYAFPLSIQLPSYDLENREFHGVLQLLKEHGFYGVELNITDFETKKSAEYVAALGNYNLKLLNVATGAYAKKKALSLSDQDETKRQQAVEEVKHILAFAESAGAGVICGFLKGGPDQSADLAQAAILRSLKELSPFVRDRKTVFMLESTNHYESSVGTTLLETVKLIEELQNPYFKILPDTYHMNIEETYGGIRQLIEYKDAYCSVHLSDNNRLFPGMGSIEFGTVLSVLKGLRYEGGIVIEGNVKNGFREDLERSVAYLRQLSKAF